MLSGVSGVQVMRDDNARAAVTSRHAYGVHVLADTDCALMIGIAMVVEEMTKESTGHLLGH